MPLSLRRGTVTAIAQRHVGLVRCEVDGEPCLAYPELTGAIALGDDVVVNAQARELRLGSGGFDILHANLTRGLGLRPPAGAHVMKLPYTPVQHAVHHGEEDEPMVELLEGMPVVCCSLHSQLAPVCAALAGRRVAYVQLPGGALPLAFSDAVRILRRRGLVEVTIAVGPCFGGELACVSTYSALALAKARAADVAVCAIGPGIVGTGSRFGHGGMAAADGVNAAAALGGAPIIAPRLSDADSRARHRGLSHHTEALLSLFPRGVRLPWPDGCPIEHPPDARAEIVDVSGWYDACAGLPLSHMGRGPDGDPWFFASAFAAGTLAARLSR
jgi:hypothetical protein